MTKRQLETARRALQVAVRKVGGPAKVGALFGITSQAVSQWAICPPRYVLRLNEESGVDLHRLAPDLYRTPAHAARVEARAAA